MTAEKSDSGWSPTMNTQEHLSTYESFISMSKVGTVAVVAILVLMAIFLL